MVTFTQTANLSVSNTDQTFNIKSWIVLPGDPLAFNDTVNKSVTSFHMPASPVVTNQTIPWGTSTTLHATSSDSVYWYNTPTGGQPISLAHNYTTPNLFANTVYYVEAANFNPTGPVLYSRTTNPIGTGTTTVGYPFYTFYMDSRTQMIYTASEIIAAGGGAGDIGKIMLDIASADPGVMNGFTIQMQNTNLSTLTGFVSTGWTTVYSSAYTVPGTGWQEITLQNPFFYDGTSNLLINICFDNAAYTSNSTVYSTTVAGKTWHQYQDLSTGSGCVDFIAGTAQTTRPNIKFNQSARGCASARVPDSVFISLFPYEASMISIPAPVNSCSYGPEHVTIRVRNNGTNTINNLAAKYSVNGGAIVTETVPTPILPNDTLTYTFATTFNPGLSTANQDSTYHIKAFISLTSDPTQTNDTLQKTVTLLYTPAPPTVNNVTIPYGSSTTLHAISSDSVSWFNVPTGGTALAQGHNYTTPNLFVNTIYYAQTSVGAGADSLFTTTAGGNGCSGGNMFDITPIGGGTTITGFAISPYAAGALPVSVYYKTGTYVGSETNAAAWTLLGTYNLNAPSANTLLYLNCADFNIPAGQTYGIYLNFNAAYTTLSTVTTYSNATMQLTAGAGLCGQFTLVNTPRGFNGKVYYGAGNGCASARVADTVFMSLFPIEASLVSVTAPSTSCSNGPEHVTIRVRNDGTTTINSFVANYSINGTGLVSETVPTPILPNDTLTYTFFATFNPGLTSANPDLVFNVLAYIELTGDPMQSNDTIHKLVTLTYVPPIPIVSNTTIPYGTSTTLHAVSNDTVFWYDVPTGGTSIATGANYTTPTLFNTTVYYAEDAIFTPNVISTVGNGTTTVGYPFYTFYMDSRDLMLYTASEIIAGGGGVGNIDKIAFNVAAADPAVMNGFTIKMQTTNLTSLSGFISTGWTTVYSGNYTVPGTGWQDITLQTPFYYNGTDNLLISVCFDNAAYTSNSTVYSTAAAGMTWHQNQDLATGNGCTDLIAGALQTTRPNIRFNQSAKGCPSARVADTVFVSGVPPCDMSVEVIHSPNTGTLLSNNEEVRVRVKNNGSTTATNVPIHYVVNGGTPVNAVIPGPINSNDTLMYSFVAHVDLSTPGTYNFKVYTDLACDNTKVNDTAHKTVVCNALVYCTSVASYTADEEIFSVTLNGATNAYSCTQVAPGPGSLLNRYSNFTTLGPLTTLSMGVATPFTILEDECDGSPYYSNGCAIWIDLNRDGDFTDPGEEMFVEPSTTISPRTINGSITVPSGSFVGVTTMRITVAESYSGTGLQPCMTYGYGETEDYSVRIAPPIPHDAGALSFFQPTIIQDEGASVPVQLIIKNFGTDTIKNSSNMTVAYKYATGAVQSLIWNGGNIPPLDTALVTLPNLTILANSQSLCGWTVLAGDSNTFNDTICTSILGVPQLDAGVTNILTPGAQLIQGASETVSVIIKNFGVDTLTTMHVGFKVNGVTIATETWTGSLLPSLSTTYTFTTPLIVPTASFSICAYTGLTGDANHTNDTTCMNSYGVFTSNIPYYDNFDGPNVNFSQINAGNGTLWELGTPNYGVTNSAFSAPNAWDINLNTAYGPSAIASLYTQYFNFSNATSAKLKFMANYYTETNYDGVRLEYSIDTGVVWNVLGVMNDPLGLNWYSIASIYSSNLPAWSNNSNGWTKHEYKLTLLDSVPLVRFRFVFTSDPSVNYDGFSIDDFSITVPSSKDAGVEAILTPVVQAQAGAQEVVKVSIHNYGLDTLYSIPVSFVANNGIPVTETWTGVVAPDSSTTYQFTTFLTIPSGAFSLCSYTGLPLDGDHLNDTTCSSVMGVPTFNVPYSDNFDGNVYFFTPGTLWEWGVPSASVINSAYSQPNAWATNLDGDYTNNAVVYLYSPLFNFQTVDSAYLDFYHWYDTQSGMDGGNIQYSVDGGNTWDLLGILNDTEGLNWYNSTIGGMYCWSGSSTGYVHSRYRLTSVPAIINSLGPVQFRYRFFSNSTTVANGWAVDNFQIIAPPIPTDAGVTRILLPNTATQTGLQIPVKVTVKNFGTNTLTSIPVRFCINGGATTNETWTGTLAPGDTTVYSFTATYQSPGTTYDLCSFTHLAGDTYYWNDSTCKTVATTPGAKDVGVTKIWTPGDSTISGQLYTVKVTIKNFGYSAITAIPMVYLSNGFQVGAGNWSGTLNIGDTAVYTFPTQFTSPLGNYNFCAKTQLTGDVNTANDQFCEFDYGTVGIESFDFSIFQLLQNTPNPSNDFTSIVFYVPTSDKVHFEMVDMLGKTVMTKDIDAIEGKNQIDLDVHVIPEGVYFYSATYKDQTRTKRMVITR
ncbi:MAG: GEVED domain-containing protein [Bacteroidota bacterium]